ncbi:MAG: DUF3997 domain-containing protein [Clostridia bacterium]|nr:DUF3997 domain-containing protein [Clostridia bacterium]
MKKLALFITLLLTLTLLCGCAGLGDWSSEPLPGGYEVCRANVHGISIIKPSEPGNGGPIIIPEEVYAIRYNDNYICVQHEESTPDENDYWKEPDGDIDYYILSVDGTIYGPYSEADYDEKIEELQIYGLTDWILPKNLPKKY